jgi:anti-anti-sigma factor
MLMETEIAEKVLTVAGFVELTAVNCKLFRKKVCAALNGHTVVDIDLSQTTSMDCAGFGALIAICNLVSGRKIRVRLVNPTSRVEHLLHIMRAAQILPIVNRPPATVPIVPLIQVTPRRKQPAGLPAREAALGIFVSGGTSAPALGY